MTFFRWVAHLSDHCLARIKFKWPLSPPLLLLGTVHLYFHYFMPNVLLLPGRPRRSKRGQMIPFDIIRNSFGQRCIALCAGILVDKGLCMALPCWWAGVAIGWFVHNFYSCRHMAAARNYIFARPAILHTWLQFTIHPKELYFSLLRRATFQKRRTCKTNTAL